MTTTDASVGDVFDFAYSGAVVQQTLRKGIWKIECWGAQGGYRSSTTYGGKGGYSVGTLTIQEPTVMYIRAGGAGNTGGTSGGFNGGGRRGTHPGGGGASDVRLRTDSLYARVIVAGGGGSDGSIARAGGAGGGASGQGYQGSGYGTNNGPGTATYSGTSTSTTASSQSTTTTGSTTAIYGGFGFGGNGQGPVNSGYGGAGGGGWYGGSGTQPDSSSDDDKAGSGGSGFVYTSATASQYPTGCLLTSADYLTDATTTIGTSTFSSPSGASETGHAGDGHVRLTLIGTLDPIATFIVDGKTTTATVPEGTAVPFPAAPEHYVIESWQVGGQTIDPSGYTISESTTFTAVGYYRYDPEDMLVLSNDLALYAVWEKIEEVTGVWLSPNPIETGGAMLIRVRLE